MRKFLFAFLLLPSLVFAQSAVIRGEASPGVYETLKSTGGVLQTIINSGTVSPISTDPCMSSAVIKSSAIIAITAAATTALVAPSGATVVYVCAFTFTISQIITTANTLKFIQGTGAACVTGPSDLTGLFGGGGITAAAPIVISNGGGTLFKTAAAGGLCVTTAIGATGNFQGIVTYVQQ